MRLTVAFSALACASTAQAFAPSVGAFNRPALASSTKSMASMPLVSARRVQNSRVQNNVATNTKMDFLTPPQVYEAVATAGETKAKMSIFKTFYLGVLAGCYIAFGSCLAMTVGGACQGIVAGGNLGVQKLLLGLFGLPTGLAMVVIAGGELFTGNTAFLSAAVIEGKATPGQLAKNWFFSYLGNLVGSVFLAYLVFASGAMAAPSVATVKAITVAKTSIPFSQAVMRGILCNWLVVMGIWQATAGKEIVSKIFGIILPISAFVTMGFEHSVANMFFLPSGMLNGAEVTWTMIFMNNLLPVTIGNTIAGAILVAGSYALMYGKPSK